MHPQDVRPPRSRPRQDSKRISRRECGGPNAWACPPAVSSRHTQVHRLCRCTCVLECDGRAVRIPVRRQRAHQSGQKLALASHLLQRRLLVGVILLTAADLAAPLFILMLAIVFIPWLLWGIAFHTERLHDRGKSAWWLLVFYAVPGVLGQLAKGAWFAGAAGTRLHCVLALAGFALSIWGFVEIGCLRGNAGPNKYGS